MRMVYNLLSSMRIAWIPVFVHRLLICLHLVLCFCMTSIVIKTPKLRFMAGHFPID